jgi:hypothetical protein
MIRVPVGFQTISFVWVARFVHLGGFAFAMNLPEECMIN